MANWNPFERSTGFGEEKLVDIQWATNEDPLDRAERIAFDKSNIKKLPDLFNVVLPRAKHAANQLRLMRIEHPPMKKREFWTELQVGGNVVIHGRYDIKWPGYCDMCNSYGKGCGPKVSRNGAGAWLCWFGRGRDADAKWGATQEYLNKGRLF